MAIFVLLSLWDYRKNGLNSIDQNKKILLLQIVADFKD
jgi:hypothetical protein